MNITCEDKDNPYLIFESLNYKGQDLTQADLVRNYIFMKLPRDLRFDIYKKEWLPIETTLKKNISENKYSDFITNFFWFYLRKDGNSVSEQAVYQTIKNNLDQPNIEIKSEIENIIQYAKYYQCIVFEDCEEQDNLKKHFKRFSKLDFNTCHIFILNIYNDFKKNQISLEQFEQILIYLESYFIRRWFTGISPTNLGGIFNNLYQEIKQNNCSDLLEGFLAVLKSYDNTKKWPDDDLFRQNFIDKEIYKKTGNNQRVKLVLASLEELLNPKEVVNIDNPTIQIEHIMPQKLDEPWKRDLGFNHERIHKKLLHTIGNLTLTGHNPSLSNDIFVTKKDIYKKSNFSLNKYFKNVDNWDEKAIKNRANSLADIAIKIWPR